MVTTMKTKQLSIKKTTGAKAGPAGKMMQRQATGPQKPGVTSQEHPATKTKGPVKGGSTKMFGKSGSKAQTPA